MCFADGGKNSGSGMKPVLEREEAISGGGSKKAQHSLLVCLSVVINTMT